MTSDAKIGLLLAFVFILVIAFLINGLPGLMAKDSSGKVVDTSVRIYGDDFGLDDKADDVVRILDDLDRVKFDKRDSKKDNDPRFEDDRVVVKKDKNKLSDKKLPANTKKFYVVKSGDNLGKIARKVYGKEIGKKQATVDMIFQANSQTLSSPDNISIDQKLIIPSLNGEKVQLDKKGRAIVKKPSKSKNGKSTHANGALDKFRDAFKNVFSKDNKDKNIAPALSADFIEYIVKEDDSLWLIAARKYGNGAKYHKIVKLNKSILNGSEDIAPGMKLKIPQN